MKRVIVFTTLLGIHCNCNSIQFNRNEILVNSFILFYLALVGVVMSAPLELESEQELAAFEEEQDDNNQVVPVHHRVSFLFLQYFI